MECRVFWPSGQKPLLNVSDVTDQLIGRMDICAFDAGTTRLQGTYTIATNSNKVLAALGDAELVGGAPLKLLVAGEPSA